jgi:DNA-directed RNA polymerase specialized sigma24 family protein
MGVRVQALTELVEDGRDELRCDVAMERDERFEEMVARQARFMFQVAFGLLRNRQDAEDAVQEAFLKLYRGEAWLRMENEKGFWREQSGVWRWIICRRRQSRCRMWRRCRWRQVAYLVWLAGLRSRVRWMRTSVRC